MQMTTEQAQAWERADGYFNQQRLLASSIEDFHLLEWTNMELEALLRREPAVAFAYVRRVAAELSGRLQ